MLENFKNYHKTESSGVYALYLDDNGAVDLFGEENAAIIKTKMTNRLLYIGKATHLSKRIEDSHLKRARTSTLRRTLANLLNMEFIPVSGKKGLTTENEKIITDWLVNNTYFKILETPTITDAEKIEDELIRQYQPPFNKMGCEEHF